MSRDWASVLVTGGGARWCGWCAIDLRGQVAIVWQGRLGCWLCTLTRAAHRMGGPGAQVANPEHRHCTQEAA